MAEVTLKVSPDSLKAVKAYAEKLGITTTAAADKLIATAVSRLNALARYAKNQKQDKPKKKAATAASSKKKASIVKPKKKKSIAKPKKKSIAKPKEKSTPAKSAEVNGIAHSVPSDV